MEEWKRSKSCADTACVEFHYIQGGVAVRDSKDPEGPVLTFTKDEWRAFIEGAVAGEFDV